MIYLFQGGLKMEKNIYSKIGEKIKGKRKELGLTVDELAEKINKNKATVYRYENGEIENLPTIVLEPLAKALQTTPAFLMGWEETNSVQSISEEFPNIEEIKTKKIPMLGKIACGTPIFAEEHHEMYVPVSEDIKADFCLRTQGDSMINAKINDGDIVFVKKQDLVENGEIAVVIVRDEATLKRVYYDKTNNIIQLLSENPQYSPMVFAGERLDEIRILGKAIAVLSML